jgi:antitoxin VapB
MKNGPMTQDTSLPETLLDARAQALAQTLAERHGTTTTEAIVFALEAANARVDAKTQTKDEFDALADELLAKSKPGGRNMTREDIDAMWGQEGSFLSRTRPSSLYGRKNRG